MRILNSTRLIEHPVLNHQIFLRHPFLQLSEKNILDLILVVKTVLIISIGRQYHGEMMILILLTTNIHWVHLLQKYLIFLLEEYYYCHYHQKIAFFFLEYQLYYQIEVHLTYSFLPHFQYLQLFFLVFYDIDT